MIDQVEIISEATAVLLDGSKKKIILFNSCFIEAAALTQCRDLETHTKSQCGPLVTGGQQMKPKRQDKLIFHVALRFVTCKHGHASLSMFVLGGII